MKNTDNIKLCVNCKWCKDENTIFRKVLFGISPDNLFCVHKNVGVWKDEVVDLTTGKVTPMQLKTCDMGRWVIYDHLGDGDKRSRCGKEGRYFEEHPAPLFCWVL